MDGTLANSEDIYNEVGTATLARRGKQFDDPLRHAMMGRPAPAALQVMIDWHQLTDTVEVLIAESEVSFWEFATDKLRAMPGVAELFDHLDEIGMPRGVATSGARSYAERILDLLGIADSVEFVITADDVTHGKPDPEPYCLAAERHGVPPAAMLVLEDSATGCQSGVASGAYTIAVPNHHTAGHDFAGAKFVAESLADERIRRVLGSGR